MASWKWPALANKILSDVPGINVLLNALLKQDPAGTTDIPAGAKRWADGADGKQFQVFNGSTWESAGKLDHDVASVDGKSVSVSVVPDTIPVRDANGKIPGDITGNADTATEASALSEVNPIEMGGTGGATAAKARENLVVPPKNHASASIDYGLGTSSQYGHTKTHDEPDATLTADAGHAFSPAGAAAMQEALAGQLGDLTGAVTEQDSALRALIAEEVAKYLPLTGGTLTGWLRFLNSGRIQTNDDAIAFYAQSADEKLGASVTLYKYDASSNAGCIVITPRNANGDAGQIVKVYPDGRVTVNDKHFVRTVNGKSAASDGSVNVDFPVAVSSVDGATGAVSTASEKSSNYIRFSSGLQLCWTTVNIANGAGTTATWTFPKAFSSAPRCTATVIGTASGDVSERNFGWYDNSSSSIKIKVDSNYGTGWHCIAVGFWK